MAIQEHRGRHSAAAARCGFTLTELLIVIMIIAILAAMSLAALSGAVEQAREARTRAIIAKIDQLISEQYESYKTRPVPIRVPAGTPPMPEQFTDSNGDGVWNPGEPFVDANGNGRYDHGAARMRLYALRELMRLEMPDRISDICNDAEIADVTTNGSLSAITTLQAKRTVLPTTPATTSAYKRRAQRAMAASGKPWTTANQGAECLYLILSQMRDGDKNALDFFLPSEIGDTDDDGMLEILDAWGRPISFLRWAPGHTVEDGFVTPQTADYTVAPDPFDPLKVDPRWSSPSATFKPFALYPLIFSAGRNRVYDMEVAGNLIYANQTPIPNDPYSNFTAPLPGALNDGDLDGDESRDNITNHFIRTQ